MDTVRKSAPIYRKLRKTQGKLGNFHICDSSEFQCGKSRRIRNVSGIRQREKFGKPGSMSAAAVLFTDTGDFTVDPRKQQVQQTGLPYSGVSGKSRDFSGKLFPQFINALTCLRTDRQHRKIAFLVNRAQWLR